MTLPSPNLSAELSYQRELTDWFIAYDPLDIALIPQVRVRTPSGGSEYQDQPARPSQRFRLIPASASQTPTVTEDGVERLIDFTLLGSWDCEMDIKDYWLDSFGQRLVIVELVPPNGYERKGLVVKHGHGGY